ncbi:uncharacterized protein MONOS_9313 [Monocercomonoides exilis]|uniref:uncharacterized protein n=1 Tax=Monocercomonoides exilis TaxID=2049356 RepID=UPI00355A8DEC|nr:hypothetical protein MONOS_9313 [Monocercomonoides exilis]|eukprot:MONOS_9313.1-p1 / transcript=MONOS_9313.1 / gene=MONOS_9313 / organism=Monocercomonoides_exilis_PA203 / gene_product=unspecified product / transcript_product=unspecified product / location=Mono_scaffold00380:24787-25805(-) / protein_length=323 / sequence_SO=supercontig / SO=protein_coding / is_pseudo=false
MGGEKERKEEKEEEKDEKRSAKEFVSDKDEKGSSCLKDKCIDNEKEEEEEEEEEKEEDGFDKDIRKAQKERGAKEKMKEAETKNKYITILTTLFFDFLSEIRNRRKDQQYIIQTRFSFNIHICLYIIFVFFFLSSTSSSSSFISFSSSASSCSSSIASAIAVGDRTTSSILSPAADSHFSTISPTSHTSTPHPITLSHSFTTTCLDCGDLRWQQRRRSACSQTSCSPTLQATEAAPPVKPKASPKAPHRMHTQHIHTMQPAMSRYIISLSYDFLRFSYTPAASGSTIRRRLSISSIAATYVNDPTTSEAIKGSTAGTEDEDD